MAKTLNEETKKNLFALLKKAGIKGKLSLDVDKETVEEIAASKIPVIPEDEWVKMSPSVRALLKLPGELKPGDIQKIEESVREGRDGWD
jgi:hypothetical protein